MFLPDQLADRIAYIFYNEDIRCRSELQTNVLVSERDYVTALTTGIRRQLISNNSIFIHTQTVPGGIERRLGADGVIIVAYDNKVKVAFFESKWPRVILNPNYNWDYLSSGESHFTNQLKRQNDFINDFAFWETFYYEGSPGELSPPFDPLGSSILLQPDAITFAIENLLEVVPWGNHNLNSILRYRGRNLFDVMKLFLKCRIGKTYPLRNNNTYGSNQNYITGKNTDLRIPLSGNETLTRSQVPAISEFMKEEGLSAYIYIDADLVK